MIDVDCLRTVALLVMPDDIAGVLGTVYVCARFDCYMCAEVTMSDRTIEALSKDIQVCGATVMKCMNK